MLVKGATEWIRHLMCNANWVACSNLNKSFPVRTRRLFMISRIAPVGIVLACRKPSESWLILVRIFSCCTSVTRPLTNIMSSSILFLMYFNEVQICISKFSPSSALNRWMRFTGKILHAKLAQLKTFMLMTKPCNRAIVPLLLWSEYSRRITCR